VPGGLLRSVRINASGLVFVEHEFEVPLRHGDPSGPQITVFVREVSSRCGQDRPFLVFFQGGPGSEAPRPTAHPFVPSWLERALEEFRVLMLDQRGTGRSTPVDSLATMSSEQQADYLTCFRADSIVEDAELIRRTLGVERWSVLGQSFGGFCVLRYLAAAPSSLREAFITGGVPPIGHRLDEVTRATYTRILDRCGFYYQRYPEDRERVLRLQDWLAEEEVVLPRGDRLTGRMFRQLGWILGMSYGAEHLHYILELPKGSRAFLHDVEAGLPGFARNPLYALLLEACCCDGEASNWSAARLLPEIYEERLELFTGEHVFPWMFTDYGALQPLHEAAELLARYEWPPLYDMARLERCEVPVGAVIYADDPYVERSFSEDTSRLIPTMRIWLTNEYGHDGLRADGRRVLGRLIELAREC
jgi:pimeloyl-ACP methyl ester carboxylesterase